MAMICFLNGIKSFLLSNDLHYNTHNEKYILYTYISFLACDAISFSVQIIHSEKAGLKIAH